MKTVRLTAIDLVYGCQEGRFDLVTRGTPLVIYGPNGAGKTTLVEALVTTLYGFDVRADARRVRERQPWHADEYRARVTLMLSDAFEDETYDIERQFHSQQTTVTRVSDGVQIFKGDADPGSGTAEARRFREWLAEHVGLETRRSYEATVCLHQGELTQTRVGDHLLRIAAGGFTSVSAARAELAQRHAGLTREALVDGGPRGTVEGELDAAEAIVLDLEHRVAGLRAAFEHRHAMLRERDTVESLLVTLRREIGQLEEALPLLVDRQVLRERRDRSAEKIAWLEGLHRDLSAAVVRVESAEQAWETVKSGPVYPTDFRERAAALAELWPQQDAAESEVAERQAAVDESLRQSASRTRAMGVAAAVLVAAGAGLAVAGQQWLAGIGLSAVGVVGLGSLIAWRRAAAARWQAALDQLELAAQRLQDIKGKVSAKASDIPDRQTLSLQTLPDRLLRFETQQRARLAFEEVRRRMHEVLTRTVGQLSERRAAEASAAGRPADARVAPTVLLDAMLTGVTAEQTAEGPAVPAAATKLLHELLLTASAERRTLTELDLQLRHTLDDNVALPSDVTADVAQVEAALRTRRGRRDEAESRFKTIDERLAGERMTASLVGLEEELAAARARWDDLTRRVDVSRRAYALVVDAYERFRATDEQRLVDNLSRQLRALTDGAIGPFARTADEGLDSLRVSLGERVLPLESPPLSYGEYHAVLLAVRLGTADFLARVGVRPPLVIDEPFTHLDEQRAERLWNLICLVARERQVIVATQDRLILRALGVTPDITLGSVPPTEPPGAEGQPGQAHRHVVLDALKAELTRWEEGE